jgi:hypothetical protein
MAYISVESAMLSSIGMLWAIAIFAALRHAFNCVEVIPAENRTWVAASVVQLLN